MFFVHWYLSNINQYLCNCTSIILQLFGFSDVVFYSSQIEVFGINQTEFQSSLLWHVVTSKKRDLMASDRVGSLHSTSTSALLTSRPRNLWGRCCRNKDFLALAKATMRPLPLWRSSSLFFSIKKFVFGWGCQPLWWWKFRRRTLITLGKVSIWDIQSLTDLGYEVGTEGRVSFWSDGLPR